MPFFDRHRWLRALCALILLAGAGTFMLWSLNHVLPLDRALGKPERPDAVMAGTIGCFLVVLAISSSLGAHAAHLRAKLRQAALYGDRDAVPLSRLADELASIPQTTTLPLAAIDLKTRRATTFAVALILAAVGIAVYVGAPAVQDMFRLAKLDVTHTKPLLHPTPTPLLSRVYFDGGAALAVLYLLYISTPSLYYLASPASHVRLDSDGARSWAAWNPNKASRYRAVRWYEAYLLEVALDRPIVVHGPKGALRCTFQGPNGTVRWLHPFGFQLPPANHRDLILPAVARHTDLELRTFDRELLARGTTSLPEILDSARHHLFVLAVGATALVGLLDLAMGAPNRILYMLAAVLPVAAWLYAWYGPQAIRTRHELERAPLLVR